jgi:hypothetical protein
MTYNEKLQLETESNPLISDVYNYAYDTTTVGALGRMTGLTIGTEYNNTYSYDTKGRIDGFTNDAGNFGYSYETESGLMLSRSSPVSTTTYAYESNRDLITTVSNLKMNTDLISIYTYENDALGRRTSRVEQTEMKPAGQFYKFQYNDRSEVEGADKYIGTDVNDVTNPVVNKGFNYTFDNIGNRTSSQILGDLEKTYASNVLKSKLTSTLLTEFRL